ncbi:MAG: hypothetical protein HY721_01805 [Planctomycetes bacterium]|nr:hypothetical protein [Planctomycetota bacterium]
MTTVAIVPEPTDSGRLAYRAISGSRQSLGKTAGEALDALTASLPREEAGTLVIVQHHHPDELFTAQQQARLRELMSRWRALRDASTTLPPGEQAELDALVEAEVRAAGERAAALLKKLEP